MKDKYFFDTKIFVYAFDKENLKKRKISSKLIANALENSSGVISFQVIQEFINVSTRKFTSPLSNKDCHRYLNVVLEPLCEVFSSIDLYYQVLEVMERWRYSFYDSLIISAAIIGECTVIYSEDMQHRQKINNTIILNPFI